MTDHLTRRGYDAELRRHRDNLARALDETRRTVESISNQLRSGSTAVTSEARRLQAVAADVATSAAAVSVAEQLSFAFDEDPQDATTATVRTEWAARYRYYDDTVKHEIGADRAHAELLTDSVTTHLASLNEATRRAGGVETAELVHRDVIVEKDGTQIIRPWQVERPGRPYPDGK